MNSSQVALRIGKLRLILPQSEVCAVESCLDLQTTTTPLANAVGMVNYAGQSWPAYCVSEELGLLLSAPSERRACVMLPLGDAYFGLLCDDAKVLKNTTPQESFALPSAMAVAHSPLTGLLRFEDGLACLSDAARLGSYCRQANAVQ